jgi:glycosyltransferase involved in cell wall biosynthesis
MFSKSEFKTYFQSIERQNYTNYHIVLVDDFSPDNTAYELYNYLQQTNSRLKNRIKIVRNKQRMGALGNMYYYMRTYCSNNNIIVSVDADDALIGAQTFNLLNKLYQNPETWFVYSNYMEMKNPS